MVNDIIAWSITYRRTVLLTLALIFLAGLYSYRSIPREAQPDVAIPWVYVSIPHEGISPEDAERLLIRPVEKELRGIEGLKQIQATAVEGHASLMIEFEVDADKDVALDAVRNAVDIAQAEFPSDTDEPVVQEINASSMFPMVNVNLSGDVSLRVLLQIARDLEREIESLSEVLEVDILGEREEVVDILIDPEVLQAYGIEQEAIFNAAARSNRLIAAGTIDTGVGRLPIKVPGLFEDVQDILNMPISATGDQVLTVEDLATLVSTYKEPETISRVNGESGITLKVEKRAGENLVRAIEKIRAIIDRQSEYWPEGVRATLAQDVSEDIQIMLTDLQNNVLSAIILVMILVVGALGLRSGLLVGIAIPGSFLAGIILLHATGMTLNIIVLFSLIMATGMLVDGAIIVTEFADRKMTEGLPRGEAYLMAAQRMGMPIIASTITTLLAFVPLLFWPDVMGDFMKYLPMTLIYTLSASLVMALIFVPALGSLVGKPGLASPETMRSLAAAEGGDLTQIKGFTGWYVRLLRFSLRASWAPLLITIVSMIAVISAYNAFGRGLEFFPDVDPEMVNINVRMRGNMSIYEMDALVREVEEAIADVEGIETMNATVQVNPARGTDSLEDTHGILQLEFLQDWQARPTGDEIIAEIRKRTEGIAGVIINVEEPPAGPPVGKPVQLELRSDFPDDLEEAVAIVRQKFESISGLIEISDTRPTPGIEWLLEVDRAEAARYGADIAMVGNAVQLATNGLRVASYRPVEVDDEVDIRVRYRVENRTLDQIENLRVNTAAGPAPLSNFVKRTPAQKVSSIHRIDAQRVHTVAANLEPGILANDVVKELQTWLAEENPLPSRVSYIFRGEDEEQRESMEFLSRAFMVALFMMAIVLLTQFNSFYHTSLILTAVVFSTIGVFLGLLITNQPFGVVMNGIGVISLAGIVVNNNIVLIDTFDHHRKNGVELLDAILRTGAQRLRPVMLTTVTTILGLMPMVMSMNVDIVNRDISFGAPSTQWWTQLSTSVAFGLAFSTFLTLIVTPSMLYLGGRVGEWGRNLKSRRAA